MGDDVGHGRLTTPNLHFLFRKRLTGKPTRANPHTQNTFSESYVRGPPPPVQASRRMGGRVGQGVHSVQGSTLSRLVTVGGRMALYTYSPRPGAD